MFEALLLYKSHGGVRTVTDDLGLNLQAKGLPGFAARGKRGTVTRAASGSWAQGQASE